ncbi:MAG: DEAD/DEAH box helicase [Deltaproteobacteria bacterium]|nr:DEAD/DEAH box helicase [Deltaproteobacteria bacterium]
MPKRRNHNGPPSSGIMQKAWNQTQKTLKELLHVEEILHHEHEAAPHMDPWQQDALEALIAGNNVVVDAPTTAGKTRVVEEFFAENIHRPDFRACYTCPVKSLSNDKLREFRTMFGHQQVGIATGDVKENIQAPIVVATLETYRNSLLGTEPDLDRHLVVFDEYHFIQDESRGSAWEEAMILTPPNSQILLLSASVDNARDFAGWLETLSTRPSRLITVEKRPVPLKDLVWFKDHWYVPEAIPTKSIPRSQGGPRPANLPVDKLCERIAKLEDWELTPCIVYAGKRASCMELAEALKHYLSPLTAAQKVRIEDHLTACENEWKSLSYMDKWTRELIQMHGIAYHHSGLTPPARMAVESLVKDGIIRFCFATMGLSLGINFSVRSTLISDNVRPGEKGMTTYSPSEVLQMKGRAGRRGKDAVGFSLWPTWTSYKKFATTRREPGFSNLRKDQTTFLGLISRGYSLTQIEKVYRKSFLKYKNPQVDMNLLTKEKLFKQISKDIPCTSPVHELDAFSRNADSLCYNCPFRKKCHNWTRSMQRGELSRLHFHLHRMGALNSEDKLSSYGLIARLFPQNGGMLIAQMIDQGNINDSNLLKASQLLAALSLARFKKPGVDSSYDFPFSLQHVDKRLSLLYPKELFPEFYDPPFGQRRHFVFRDFNPVAGFIIREWAMGASWDTLTNQVITEQFSDGDLTALIYRTTSYLQSFAGLMDSFPVLARTALDLRAEMMREPVAF